MGKPLKQSEDTLPDVLRAGLRLVFVGTAAGRRSAAVGHYYAHPGNRFWRALHETGITPRRYEPHEYARLLDLGIGFTDVAKRAAGMDHQIARTDFSPTTLSEKIARFRPGVVAFTSKRAASVYLGKSTRAIAYGPQPSAPQDGPVLFVLTSPSGAASRSWSVETWRTLAALIA